MFWRMATSGLCLYVFLCIFLWIWLLLFSSGHKRPVSVSRESGSDVLVLCSTLTFYLWRFLQWDRWVLTHQEAEEIQAWKSCLSYSICSYRHVRIFSPAQHCMRWTLLVPTKLRAPLGGSSALEREYSIWWFLFCLCFSKLDSDFLNPVLMMTVTIVALTQRCCQIHLLLPCKIQRECACLPFLMFIISLYLRSPPVVSLRRRPHILWWRHLLSVSLMPTKESRSCMSPRLSESLALLFHFTQLISFTCSRLTPSKSAKSKSGSSNQPKDRLVSFCFSLFTG